MKLLRKNLKATRKAVQKGFTLIELAVVGLFLGLLAVFAISQFSGAATDNTKATSMFESAQKLSDNWAILAQTCAVSSDVTATVVGSGAGTTNADKNLSLLLGTAAVSSTYQNCYNSAGIRPLTGMSTGAAGAEKINEVDVDLVAVDSRNIGVLYKSVPKNVFEAMYLKYSGSTTLPASTATATASSTVPFGYTAETSGARNVTFVRPL